MIPLQFICCASGLSDVEHNTETQIRAVEIYLWKLPTGLTLLGGGDKHQAFWGVRVSLTEGIVRCLPDCRYWSIR